MQTPRRATALDDAAIDGLPCPQHACPYGTWHAWFSGTISAGRRGAGARPRRCTPELARRALLELTRPGLDVLATHLGLPLGHAARHHGLAGDGPTRPVGPRAALLAPLSHTLCADAVFAALARTVPWQSIPPAGHCWTAYDRAAWSPAR